jgi:hypothetical protein
LAPHSLSRAGPVRSGITPKAALSIFGIYIYFSGEKEKRATDSHLSLFEVPKKKAQASVSSNRFGHHALAFVPAKRGGGE